jgi:hypothetical protein
MLPTHGRLTKEMLLWSVYFIFNAWQHLWPHGIGYDGGPRTLGPCVVALRFYWKEKDNWTYSLLARPTTGTDDNWGGYRPLCNEQRAAGIRVDVPNRVDWRTIPGPARAHGAKVPLWVSLGLSWTPGAISCWLPSMWALSRAVSVPSYPGSLPRSDKFPIPVSAFPFFCTGVSISEWITFLMHISDGECKWKKNISFNILTLNIETFWGRNEQSN